MPTYLGPTQSQIDMAGSPAHERGTEDYDVQGLWSEEEHGIGYTNEETIGSVTLAENASWQDMPEELEINGFTYKIER